LNYLAELQRLVDNAPGTGNHRCALCLHRFETHPEKTQHMESIHGYTTLDIKHMHSVYLIPQVQCADCLSVMSVSRGKDTLLQAWCARCDITVKLPIAPLACEVVDPGLKRD
jgi:hypothetical protein